MNDDAEQVAEMLAQLSRGRVEAPVCECFLEKFPRMKEKPSRRRPESAPVGVVVGKDIFLLPEVKSA